MRSSFRLSALRSGTGFATLLIFSAAIAAADYLKVDIDAGWPARSDTTAAGFTPWALLGDLDASRRSATHTFSNTAGALTCTLRQTAPADSNTGICLNASWLNKNGIAGGYKLAFDGVWVHQKDDARAIDRPYAGGGAFELVVAGLTVGQHTITTYHNALWGSLYGAISRCRISVDGTVVTTITPSAQVTNDNDCVAAFFTVNATAGQPLVIRFTPDGSGPLDTVILNGFEIDRPSAPGTVAVAPSPADGDEHVDAGNDVPGPNSEGRGSTTLSWTAAANATSHDVYFGTDRDAVAVANHASPLFHGNQTATTCSVQALDSTATYYWRVDEVTAAGNTVTGAVWSFRTRHLAFPGAEGYGRFARGGRGGRVIEVTNLLDYGSGEPAIPGSYRAAIEATGPRTVVFRVSGLIRLKRECPISSANGYLTIAGQTAPGDGICLANYSAGIGGAHDVIMRFVRERVGDASRQAMDGIGMGVGTDHSIVDHCTISWTLDEGTSSRDGRNVTFQRNIVSEPLQHSYHYAADDRTKYEEHAFAGSISGNIGSYHHNLLAHCTDRNWSLAGGLTQDGKYAGRLDIRNNVVFNWVGRTTDGGVRELNYVNNYYKPGPNTKFAKWLLRLDRLNPDWGPESYYMTGNVLEGYVDEAHNWDAFAYYGESDPAKVGAVAAQVRVDHEIYPSYVTTHTAKEAFKLVLSDVGANQPKADAIDRRIVQEVRTGSWHYQGTRASNWPNNYNQPPAPNYPGIIDTPDDVHDANGSPDAPWPLYATYNVPIDSDHDGMPDTWEKAIGSDPLTANSNDDGDRDGYTVLEDYLAWLAGPHAYALNDRPSDVDLRPFAAGFTAPRFTVSSPVLGTIVLQPDGRIARFAPASGATGRGGFAYTVTDSDGVTVSGFYGLCLAAEPPRYETLEVGQLANLSVRAVTRSKEAALTMGFVVHGGNKTLLARGIGPGLAPFGVSDAIGDPKLDFRVAADAGTAPVATNDDWGSGRKTPAEMRALFAGTGAFALSEGSKDAALVIDSSTGGSVLLYDTANRSGIAMAELYDASPASPGRLVNTSVLNFAGADSSAFIVGFNIAGLCPKRLLIRAIGPTLATFGIGTALGNPKLQVTTLDGKQIDANDDWGEGDVTLLRAAFASTGAFELRDTTSKDAALVLTLAPGSYTAIVSASSGAAGDALLELYEMP